jgi:hypothetical protein
MFSACAFYLAAFRPEEMKTGNGAGRALFFGRYERSLRRPTRRKGLSAAIPQIASLPRGVTNIFASWRGGAMLRMDGSTDEGRAYGP